MASDPEEQEEVAMEHLVNLDMSPREEEDARQMMDWMRAYNKAHQKSLNLLESTELGGHMELKKNRSIELIGPSKEFVDDAIMKCAAVLGVKYENR